MSKTKFEIKNRWTGSVLFKHEKENNTLKDTVEQAIKEGANLEGADLGGANLKGAYIYISDDKINTSEIIKDFEEKNGIKITDTYISKNIIPTRWNAFWKFGLIICDWEVIKKEELVEENKEIEELKTEYKETSEINDRGIAFENRFKINELVRAVNKLIKESEEK